MDMDVVADPSTSDADKQVALFSLYFSFMTMTLAPNAGGFIRSGDEIASTYDDVLRGATDNSSSKIDDLATAIDSMPAKTNVNKMPLTSGGGGSRVGPAFDPQKLDKITENLQIRGVEVDSSPEAQRFLEWAKANALYMAIDGKPGTLFFKPNATRLEVVEELVHHGQHLRAKYKLPTNSLDLSIEGAKREIEAQDILLKIAYRLSWTTEEIAKIMENKAAWVKKLDELTNQ